jgi:hypothetical protein
MQKQVALIVAFCLSAASPLQADGLLYRLPKDGTWARYSVKQNFRLPKGLKLSTEGTLILASVGQEKVNDEVCRWIEMVLEWKVDGQKGTRKSIFKALIPEKRLKKGEDPTGHWVRGWAKVGDQAPQALTKELVSNPAMLLNLVAGSPLQNARALKKKVIETKLGKLTCEGLSGSLTLKGTSKRVNNGKVTTGDGKVRVETYFHNNAPFGVVTSRWNFEFEDLGEGKNFAQSDLTLIEVGTGAKSELPDQK